MLCVFPTLTSARADGSPYLETLAFCRRRCGCALSSCSVDTWVEVHCGTCTGLSMPTPSKRQTYCVPLLAHSLHRYVRMQAGAWSTDTFALLPL